MLCKCCDLFSAVQVCKRCQVNNIFLCSVWSVSILYVLQLEMLMTVGCCLLQVQNFLARLRSKRFPSIEEDMAMLQAHCGSLLLDPAVIAEVLQ